MNRHFVEMLHALSAAGAEYLVQPAGLEFEEAWKNRVEVELAGERFPVLGKADLIRSKRAVGRPEDLADIARLEQLPG